jgi:hypothetical protein
MTHDPFIKQDRQLLIELTAKSLRTKRIGRDRWTVRKPDGKPTGYDIVKIARGEYEFWNTTVEGLAGGLGYHDMNLTEAKLSLAEWLIDRDPDMA